MAKHRRARTVLAQLAATYLAVAAALDFFDSAPDRPSQRRQLRSGGRRAARRAQRSPSPDPESSAPGPDRKASLPLPPALRTTVAEAREDPDAEGQNARRLAVASDPEELTMGALYAGKVPTTRSECLRVRGQSGQWVRDKGYRYENSGGLIRNGPEDERISVRTKWRWADDARSCRMHRLSRASFCNLMELLGVGRVFFVGDSISFMQANSLWWLLGGEGDLGSKLGYGYQEQEIRCAATDPGEAPYVFTLAMARDDNLRASGEDDHHHDWAQHYLASDARTILIANTGAHTPPEQYEQDMNAFVDIVLSFNRPQDTTIYRTSIPGHTRCRQFNKPLASAQEYSDMKMDQSWNWMHMADFNAYSKGRVDALAAAGRDWSVLDVTPMTILRPDGHKRPNVDCLHYLYPGPQDAWNHLLYSNLLELAVERFRASSGEGDPFVRLRTPLGQELARVARRLN